MRHGTARTSIWKVIFFNQYNLLFLAGAAAFSLALASRWPGHHRRGGRGPLAACRPHQPGRAALGGSPRPRAGSGPPVGRERRGRRRPCEPEYAARVEKLETHRVGHSPAGLGPGARGRPVRRPGEPARVAAARVLSDGRPSPAALPLRRHHQRRASSSRSSWASASPSPRRRTPRSGSSCSRRLTIAQRRFEQQEQLGQPAPPAGREDGHPRDVARLPPLPDLRRSIAAGALGRDRPDGHAASSFLLEIEAEVNTSVERIKPTVVPVTQPQVVRGS